MARKPDFTDGMTRALNTARAVAIGWNHDYIGTEHLLAALLEIEETLRLRERLNLTSQDLKQKLVDSVRRGRAVVPEGRALPYTSRANRALQLAFVAAREMGDDAVGPDHLLLGLLREEKGIAAQLLKATGVTNESANRAVWAGRAGFHVQIDDAADVSIYEQIVAQVQEAVATGVLSAGERLPTVRQLADELDIAPGTVARAYSELERRGIVITEGARGTRVADREKRAEPDRPDTLASLLRPVAVAAYHMGATAQELRTALERAMRGIFAEADG